MNKRKALWIAGGAMLVLGAVLLYRMRGSSFEWRLFLDTLHGISWFWLIACVFLNLLSYWGRALRWEVMLRPLGRRASVTKLTYDTTIGFTAVVLLGRAGEVVRPYLIALRAGVPFSSQMAAWVLERILDLLAVLLIFGVALIRVPGQGLPLGPGLRWVLSAGGYLVAGIAAVSLLLLIVFRNFADTAQRRILGAVSFLPPHYHDRIARMLAAFSQGMESTRDSRGLLLLIAYTALEWIIILAGFYALFLTFPATLHLSITDVVVFVGFLAFGGLVQIPGIGGGIQVTSIVVLTQIFGIPVESATALALFIWILTFVVVVPPGLLFAFHEGLNWSKLKRISMEQSSQDAAR